jgi:hypothetical protein
VLSGACPAGADAVTATASLVSGYPNALSGGAKPVVCGASVVPRRLSLVSCRASLVTRRGSPVRCPARRVSSGASPVNCRASTVTSRVSSVRLGDDPGCGRNGPGRLGHTPGAAERSPALSRNTKAARMAAFASPVTQPAWSYGVAATAAGAFNRPAPVASVPQQTCWAGAPGAGTTDRQPAPIAIAEPSIIDSACDSLRV